MKLLTNEQFDQAYNLFEKAFIPAELRPYELMKTLFLNKEFLIYGLFKNDEIIAAIIVWEFDDFIYLENFAVSNQLRGQGIGGYILEEMKKIYLNRLIVLEVEQPFDEMSQRRIAFYKRHQWILNPFHYIQPLLRENSEDVHLMLMSTPHCIDEDDFQHIKNVLFQKVYKQTKEE